ncbi:hypothetical protein [Luteolibacter luteus]|uniref:O-antigen ligase domain-containing protein n=1 Tax=Luteolibacter luteus TaxID=2728835 RepID=A0A858RK57_9BACT|nr:hypothetical protein [Luteolibacter luteus]QJE96961.1 hypothetical protein HHL09_14580 [Luteolibacter luteus]
MESSQIKALFIIVIASLFAVYLGVAAATAQFEAIAWVSGFMGLAMILALGRNVWLLIPAALSMEGSINALPGSPPVWALAAAITGTMYVARFAMRRPDFNLKLDLIDFAILLQLIVIAQAYTRNPTGLLLLGGAKAGGKAYFIFAAAFLAYICIAVTKPREKSLRWVVGLMVVVAVGDGLISTISDWSASFSALVLPFYSNVNFVTAISGSAGADLDVLRGGGGFFVLGQALVLPCFCLVRPISCLNPLRPFLFVTVCVGCLLVLLSGFRSGAAYLAVVFVVSALIRRKPIDAVIVSLLGTLALVLVLISGKVRSLPFGVQRVLSVLPVDVSSAARADAENSTEWRIEMWKLALTTDRYIQNKTLGDGFGFSAAEMKAVLDAAQGHSDFGSSQDQMLAQGSYHGFHVETIRFTGVVGLLAALFLMIVAFRKAMQLIRFYRGTPMFPAVAFICIPFVIYPLWSMLVFGSYRSEFPQFIVTVGLLKWLDNLRLSQIAARATAPAEEPVPATPRRGRLPVPAYAVSGGRQA